MHFEMGKNKMSDEFQLIAMYYENPGWETKKEYAFIYLF